MPGSGAKLLEPARFGTVIDGRPVGLYVLKNAAGMTVAITNYGAKIAQILVPDRHGVFDDVVLGYDSIEGYVNGSPSMGAFIGRYAGRIGHATFTLNGRRHTLTANNGPDCLHGGAKGSRFRVFNVERVTPSSLALRYVFADGEEGFPGELDLRVTYTVTEANELSIDYEARAIGEPTIANFTSHAFFNLEGESSCELLTGSDEVLDSVRAEPVEACPELGEGPVPSLTLLTLRQAQGERGGTIQGERGGECQGERFRIHRTGSVSQHQVMIASDQVLGMNAELLATGEVIGLAGGALDLREPTLLSERLGGAAVASTAQAARDPNRIDGYDDCYVVRPETEGEALKLCARVSAPSTGRVMETWSTEPCVQFYTGKVPSEKLVGGPGKSGDAYFQQNGFCVEPQGFPNAPHCPWFESAVVKAGANRGGRIVYRFTVL
jgi:galactose mutarotase-like enzyme